MFKRSLAAVAIFAAGLALAAPSAFADHRDGRGAERSRDRGYDAGCVIKEKWGPNGYKRKVRCRDGDFRPIGRDHRRDHARRGNHRHDHARRGDHRHDHARRGGHDHGWGHRHGHRHRHAHPHDWRPRYPWWRHRHHDHGPRTIIRDFDGPPPLPGPVTAVPPPPRRLAAAAPAETYCREYQTTTVVNGRAQPAYGLACRQPDGSWKIAK